MAALIPGNAVALLALLALVIDKTSSVRVLVVRENPDSRSADDSGDSLGIEESEEIDFLVDLLKNEAKEQESPPPVTTVRIIKRKPEPQISAQHSIRKERVESGPRGFKEYHVHYHSHQHKEPRKPFVAYDEGSFKPILWDSQLPMGGNFETYKQFQRDSTPPYSETARVKSFKDFDSFLKSKLRPSDYRESSFPASSDNTDHEIRIQAVKDFETIIKPKFNVYKSKNPTTFERIKNYQDFIDSDEDKGMFLNKERFAKFKDFSEIESPPTEPTKPPEEEDKPPEVTTEKKSVKVRDFAIVIKTKPQPATQNKGSLEIRNYRQRKPPLSRPKTPPFVNKLRVPNERHFSMPRVLESPGGAPKYIDRLNSLKYPQADMINSPFRQNFHANALDLDNRFFKMGLWPQPSISNLHLRNTPSQLFIRRQSK